MPPTSVELVCSPITVREMFALPMAINDFAIISFRNLEFDVAVVDESKICMFISNYPVKDLTNYLFKGDGPELIVNVPLSGISGFLDILSKMNPETNVNLLVTNTGIQVDAGEIVWSCSALTSSIDNNIKMPGVTYEYGITVDALRAARDVPKLGSLNDLLTFSMRKWADGGKIFTISNLDILSDAVIKVNFREGEPGGPQTTFETKECIYPEYFINRILEQIWHYSSLIHVEFESSYPLRIRWANTAHGPSTFLLAPRVFDLSAFGGKEVI